MAKNPSLRPTPRKRGGAAPRAKAPSASSLSRPARSGGSLTGPGTARPKQARPAKAAKVRPAKLAKPAKAAKPAKPAKPAKVKPTRLSRTARRAQAARVPGPAGAAAGARPAFLDRAQQVAGSVPRAGSAKPRPASGAERRQRHQRGWALRVAGLVAGGVAAVGLVLVVAFFALRNSTVFSIDSVQVEPTAHVAESDIQNLVQVPEGSTLLNVDTAAITESLRHDPWVADVTYERIFPHTLKVNIIEQAVDALVVMNTGSVAWYLGDAGIWIQPTGVESAEGQSVNDAALAVALEEGCLLITDVPATVSPVAGSEATDEVLEAVRQFREGFSDDFNAQVVCYSAASTDSITCTLANGVEVLLGSPTDISTKEAIVTQTLAAYPDGGITYVSVRVVTNPVVRLVGSEDVSGGTGVTSTPVSEPANDGSGSAAGGDAGAGADDDDGGAGSGDSTDGDGTASDLGTASDPGHSASGDTAGSAGA